MIPDSNILNDLLSFDPLHHVEEVFGVSYKDSKECSAAGFLLAINHNQNKREILSQLNDTHHGMDIARYRAIIEEVGFELALELPFTPNSAYVDDPQTPDTFYVYAHRTKGILLKFDSYNQAWINGGKYLYCWKPHTRDFPVQVTSSGGYRHLDAVPRGQEEGAWKDRTKLYWAGDHDCREALRFHIERLEEHGTFLAKWPTGHKHFLWLLHYGDTRNPDYDYKAINKERVAMLPEWVQEMINVPSKEEL